MIPGLGVGIFSAASSIYDTYQSNKTARQNTDKTIAANKAEAELAYQRQQEMWHMQNEYNTPESQMLRYQAAGLNPHLIYGQGNSGNASGMPSYNPPHIQYQYQAGKYGQAAAQVIPMMMSIGTWVQDMRIKEAQLKGITQETMLKSAKTMSASQLYEYLEQANPEMLRKLSYGNTLLARQSSGQLYKNEQMQFATDAAIMKLITEYGGDFASLRPNYSLDGMSALKYSKLSSESQRAHYEAKLKKAMASWTDYDITNPQALIQMVLGGAMHAATGLSVNAMKRKVPVKQVPRRTSTNTSYYYDQKGRKSGQSVDYGYDN